MSRLDTLSSRRAARDTELMQSYLRTEPSGTTEAPGTEGEPAGVQAETRKKEKKVQFAGSGGGTTAPKKPWLLSKELKQKKKPKRRKQEESYTDKDRAAAVNMGTKDIKQSLRLKRKEERSKALQIPEETRPGTLLALADYELRLRRQEIAYTFITKALDLNPTDKVALVERCKCHLLLGQPALALKDAEAALTIDPNYIKALLQKAESLYFLGKFEEALMYFHRGLKARPDLAGFRLGVAKATEAIQNIIGENTKAFSMPTESLEKMLGGLRTVEEVVRAAEEKRKSKGRRPLLGSLQEDKEYLERILREKADIINLSEPFASNETELYAREILDYLDGRSEFWSQQRPKVR